MTPFLFLRREAFLFPAARFLSSRPFFLSPPPLLISDHSCAFLLISRRLSGDFRAFSPDPEAIMGQ